MRGWTGEIFDIMNVDRIDFISSYCDRRCERCAFTSRCSLFAVQKAIATITYWCRADRSNPRWQT